MACAKRNIGVHPNCASMNDLHHGLELVLALSDPHQCSVRILHFPKRFKVHCGVNPGGWQELQAKLRECPW
eukprot:1728328-Amphidinium_carterae.1